MRLCTPENLKKIDSAMEQEFQVSGDQLMELAGKSAAEEIKKFYFENVKIGEVVVLCGPGNNGGDGLVISRYLHEYKIPIKVILISDFGSPLFNLKLSLLKAKNISYVVFKPGDQILGKMIVDSLFGAGQNRQIEGKYLELVSKVNKLNVPVFGIDGPTGLDQNSGEVLGSAIKCTMVLAMGISRPGFYQKDGPSLCGKIKVIPLGYKSSLFEKYASECYLFNQHLFRKIVKKRTIISNKSHFGSLAVIGGSSGMWGALALATEAAYRVGVGYVTVVPNSDADAVRPQFENLGSEVLVKEFSKSLQNCSTFVIGPGSGTSSITEKRVGEVLKSLKPTVLDADGLNVLEGNKRLKKLLHQKVIITPHEGELGRILGVTSEEIRSNRIMFARKASKELGAVVLLKGFRPLVVTPNQKIFIINSGNQSLAKAGTGDVLAGMIGGFLAQGLSVLSSACSGAYLHGYLADCWVKRKNAVNSLMPRDLINEIPQGLGELGG